MHFTLEKQRFFPYLAWALVIGFAIFTYSLSMRLADATKPLAIERDHTVSVLKNNTN